MIRILVRNILATIAGLFVGSCVNMALVLLNAYVLFPMPEGTDMNDQAQMLAWIGTLPTAAFLVVVAAHLGQAFVGGWLAARLSASKPMIPALVVGVLTLVGGVVNMVALPGPAWMWIEVPLYLIVSFAAGKMEEKRRAAISVG